MRIELNGTCLQTRARTLAELVAEQHWDAASVATAVDGRFVAREARTDFALAEGMRIEALVPMQGG